jgi:hypothetical protein
MVTVHVPVPLHAPPHPVKVEPEAAAAVNVTLAPPAKDELQALPQLIPLGVEVTVPAPVPLLATVRT